MAEPMAVEAFVREYGREVRAATLREVVSFAAGAAVTWVALWSLALWASL